MWEAAAANTAVREKGGRDNCSPQSFFVAPCPAGRRRPQVVYIAFDVLYFDGSSVIDRPLRVRWPAWGRRQLSSAQLGSQQDTAGGEADRVPGARPEGSPCLAA
jgi:hypothetical protein